VNVLYGSATGLSGRSEAVWHQGRADVLDNAEVGDSFGFSLAVGEWHASPPPMPDNVEASDGTSNSEIRITWDGVSRATYYSIWWSDSPTGWTWFLDTTTNSSYDHTSVPPCTLNYYWISACNDNGCSRLSGPDSGYQAMVPPINLDASDGTYTDKVRITFDVTSGAESYGFFRATSLAGERLLLSPGSSETTFEDTTASPGRVYYYWVLASNGFCIEWSGYDTGHRAISPPKNVAASDGTESDRVHVTWDAATGATAYRIYRATSVTGARAEVGTTADTTYTDTAADPGILYFYWVKGCNGPRCSDASTPDSGYCGEVPTHVLFLPLVLRR
jgi:fibronectin type 3 domain-containing protein